MGDITGDILSLNGRSVVFSYTRSVKVGKTAIFTLKWPNSRRRFQVPVMVGLANDRDDRGVQVHGTVSIGERFLKELNFARLESDDDFGERVMSTNLPPVIKEGSVEERPARVPFSCLAFSSQLPRKKAFVIDLSTGGVRVKSYGPVKKGEVIKLTLELPPGFIKEEASKDHHQEVSKKVIEAQVRWCRPSSVHKYEVGLQFTELSERQLLFLTRMVEALEEYRS